jgi:serine/threonine-protein kinase
MPTPPPRPHTGVALGGRYAVDGLLAEGGMSRVLAVRHAYSGRPIALKVLLPGTPPEGEVAARLLREARALEVARHPGVVELLDAGRFDDGQPYLALERLEGETVDACLQRRGVFAVPEATRLAIELCEALGPAHAGGLVHRDVKPSNVFVVRTRANDERVKLIDFGIAALPDAQSPAGPAGRKLTQEGTFLGTPSYMAPEQLSLRKPTDRRADVYAIGATLFELLAGRPPYPGTYADILVAQMTRPVPDVREHRADVPPALAAVLVRALAREPEDRPGDVSLLRNALLEAVPQALARPLALLGRARRVEEEEAAEPAPILLLSERRRHRRAPFSVRGWLTSTREGRQIEIAIEDVSEGGVAIHAPDAVPGAPLALVFVAPGASAATIVGTETQWVRPDTARGGSLVGLRFLDPLPEDARAAVRALVALRGVDR